MPHPDIDAKQEFFEQAQNHIRSMQIPQACECFTMAEQAGFDPDACAAGRWSCHMLLGDFETAWRESDAISRRGNPDPHRFWDGQPFDGRRVLIRCLHGLGDTLQYVRYAPLIRQKAATLTIEAQPLLKSLLDQSDVADSVTTWGEREPAWDQQIEIVELPLIFRTMIQSIPHQNPYIHVPAVTRNCSVQGNAAMRVGLVWASSAFNPARSILLEQLAELFDFSKVSFFSFQAGEEHAQLAPWANRVSNLYVEGQSVLETAMSLNTMDLVITVDTMTAHLAGAMGLDVWTLLPYVCDWRWMLHREDSPWYPTMRLFRQPRPEDWRSVVNRVKSALDERISRYSPGSTK